VDFTALAQQSTFIRSFSLNRFSILAKNHQLFSE